MTQKTSALAQIKNLKPGQTVAFPIERLFAIRTAVSNVNTMRGNKVLSTSVDRKARTISVIRK